MKPHILIVEDEPALLATFTAFLETTYTVFDATNGQDAFNYLQDITFKALIVDLGLPDLNGIDIVKSARIKYPTLPIIVLTSDKTSDSVQGAIKAGADDYIIKPSTQAKLLQRIEKAIFNKDLQN